MKKIIALLMALTLTVCAFTSCAKDDTDTTASTTPVSTEGTTTAKEDKPESTEFTMYYPSYMQDTYGDKLVLPKKPEKVIVLSNSAMQIMVRCDFKPIAVTNPNKQIPYPDYIKELPVITTGMSKLDVESILAKEPDLLIMGAHLDENFGDQIRAAGIPIYFTSEGPSITYNEVKEEAIVLARSFGGDAEAAKVEAEFEAVEKRAADVKYGTEAMILFGAPPSHQQTSKGYLGSILNLMGFTNISDGLIGADARTAPLDMEKLVELNPSVLFAISPTCPTAENIEGIYKEEYTKNPQIWENLNAVKNDKVIYLSSEYVTSKGIHIISSINNLIDALEAKLG